MSGAASQRPTGIVRFTLLMGVLAAAMAGCAPATPPPAAHLAPDGAWSQASRPVDTVRSGAVADLRSWFEGLPDPTLRRLVDEALAGNLDVAQARSRIRSARAQLDLARSAGLPSVNLGANTGRARVQRQDLAGRIFPAFEINQFQTELAASWELDLFGSVAASVEGARANLGSAEASLRATQISLAAQVMQVYIDLRSLQYRRGLAKDSITSQRDTLALTRSRGNSGLATQVDVDTADTQTVQIDAALWLFDESIERDRHALAVLTGRAPLGPDPSLDAASAPPTVLPPVPIVVPAQWLRNRPDILAADLQAQAAAAQLAVARTSYLPNVMLTAGGGASAYRIQDLFSTPSLLWSTGAGLTQTLFSGGRLDANRTAAEAALEQQELSYRKTVLTAMQDVEDQLSVLRGESARVRMLEQGLRLSTANRDRARDLFRAGLVDGLTVLVAERSVLSASDSLEQAREQQQLAQVSLFKAMGGGWIADVPPNKG